MSDLETSFDPLQGPVFILGLHRSGTTVLYEMLSETGFWNTLWAWHVVSYDDIRAGRVNVSESQADFTRRLAEAGMETRGVDAVKAGPETKEEYCFISDNRKQGTRLTEKSLPLFHQICQTVQSTFQEERPLLLKNPWDFANGPAICRLVPTARFIYIHRHPIEVINSMWKFLEQAFQEPNAYIMMLSREYRQVVGSWKMGAMRFLVRRMSGMMINLLIWWVGRQCDQYLRTAAKVSDEIKAELTYDQLCGTPNETIQRIRESLDIPDNQFDFSSMVKRRERRCDPKIEARAAKIEKRCASYLQHISDLEAQHPVT